MSADLFAEFGELSQSSKKADPPAYSAPAANDLLVDFGFSNEAESTRGPQGDFTRPETAQKEINLIPAQLVKESSPVLPAKPPSPDPWFQDPSPKWEEPQTGQTESKPEELWRRDADGSDVLFDASMDNSWNDDDFGDFEAGTSVLQSEAPVTISQDPPRSPDIATGGQTTDTLQPEHAVAAKSPDLFEDITQPAFPETKGPSNLPNFEFPASHGHDIFQSLPIREKPAEPLPLLEAESHHDIPPADTTSSGAQSEDTRVQVEDEWGDFMDAPAGALEGDEVAPYPANIPTISSSPPPEFDLPTEQVHSNPEPLFGFIPFERKKPRPNLADIERPTSFSSTHTSDGEESPGWDWKVSAGPKSPSKPSSKSAAPPSLLRPSITNAHGRPSSFSTVASSDGDRSPGWDWKASEPPNPVEHVRPFNIPPPSVLLQVFPPIFERFQERIFQETVSRSSDKLKDTSLLELGREVGAVSRVTGRILAGRKHRWRRDTNLSQNMKIGPAQTGKGGGMKLTGIDKSENTKEEREAEDVLLMWKKYSGLFRSAVSGAGGNVVELSENMPIKALGQTQGAFKATHPCALCGLMRDERVAKVDGPVEDSFGEWWTEHWGHLECRLFWEENQASLAQR